MPAAKRSKKSPRPVAELGKLVRPAAPQEWMRVLVGGDGIWVEFFATKREALQRARYQFRSAYRERGDRVYVARVEATGEVRPRR